MHVYMRVCVCGACENAARVCEVLFWKWVVTTGLFYTMLLCCYVANTVRYQLEAISSVRPNPYPNPNPTSWKHLFRKAPAGAPQAKPEDASNAAPTGEMVAVDPVHGESDEHELPWQVRW